MPAGAGSLGGLGERPPDGAAATGARAGSAGVVASSPAGVTGAAGVWDGAGPPGADGAAAAAAGEGIAAGCAAGACGTDGGWGAGAAAAPAIGRSAWRSIASPQLGQKLSSLLWMAAQRGHAVMPASRSTVIGLALAQGAFDRAQLAVDVAERRQLGEHERVVALPEAVQVEDESAEIAIRELACLAQEAQAAARPTARLEAGRLRRGDGLRRSNRLGCGRRACGGDLSLRLLRRVCMDHASLIHLRFMLPRQLRDRAGRSSRRSRRRGMRRGL